ncbi:MAG: VOC family protein [Candidatus Eisenbacteria bacterium]
MASAAAFLTVTPLIPTGVRLAEAVAFYTGQLGFAVTWQSDNMAGIRRGGVEFNLIENSDRAWADNASFSIGVDDLDALHEEYGAVAARVGPLEEKGWGRREFHMIVPSGVCLQFYQSLA